MGDLKLLFLEFYIYIGNVFEYFALYIFEKFISIFFFIDPTTQHGLSRYMLKTFYYFPQNMTFFFAIKFCLCIAFLILIRGGTPRYRYDYLSKLGWLKILGWIILIFFCALLLFYIF